MSRRGHSMSSRNPAGLLPMNTEEIILFMLGAFGVGLLSLLFIRRMRRGAMVIGFNAEFTDDMRIDLPAGVTYEKLASFVIESALRSVPDDETEVQLVQNFHLSPDDAALVRDRVFGGVFRALWAVAGNRHNNPDSEKDPLASAGFKLVMAEPSIASRIYPQFPAAKPAE